MIKVFVISILVTLFASGCKTKEESDDYHGFYPELYSIAIDSLLGARGYSYDERDRDYDLEITVMERDKYGRNLYLYNEHSEKVNRYNLIISQKSTDEYTYYYSDYNFISASENSFSEEEIEELKRRNDWDKEINLDKCKKIHIVRKKEEGPVKRGKLGELYRKALGEEAYWHPYSTTFFTTDDYGRSLYLGYGIISSNRRHVVMLFNPDGSYDESKCVMELTDVNKYQDELKEFKELNDWNQPLEE